MAKAKTVYLKFHQLGDWFDQVLLGRRIKVMAKKTEASLTAI